MTIPASIRKAADLDIGDFLYLQPPVLADILYIFNAQFKFHIKSN